MIIKEIQLLTNQPVSIKSFYKNKLGFYLMEESDDSFSFLVGSSILTFIITHKKTFPYHFAFNIPQYAISECYHFYNSKLDFILNIENPDLKIPIYDFSNWKAEAIYFFDPDHNIVEFIARSEISDTLENEFSNKDILSISEMGIVTKSCNQKADEYFSTFGIPKFIHSKGSDSFYPIGTNSGLFILVKEDRIWYATDSPAKQQYSKIIFQVNEQRFEIETAPYQ